MEFGVFSSAVTFINSLELRKAQKRGLLGAALGCGVVWFAFQAALESGISRDFQSALFLVSLIFAIALVRVGAREFFAPKPQVKRRKRVRSTCIAVAGPEVQYNIVDISEEGAFLETDEKLKEGEKFPLTLKFEDTIALVEAKIVHRRWVKGRPGGIGVSFNFHDDRDRTAVKRYVDAGSHPYW